MACIIAGRAVWQHPCLVETVGVLRARLTRLRDRELALLVAAFAVLRIVAVVRTPYAESDTPTYDALDFFGGAERLWTVPLVYKVLPADWLREAAQLSLGIIAWSLLASAVYRLIEGRRLRLLATAGVLLLGLVSQIAAWDSTLLSESLAISLFVVVVAWLLRIVREGATVRLLAATIALTILWVFTRQLSAMTFIALLPVVIVIAARGLPRRRAVATIAALLVLGAWAGFALTGDQGVARWNSLGIVVDRIAPDPDALRFFQERGLPRDPQVVAEAGHYSGAASPLWHDGELMAWIDNHFKSAYASYLTHHAGRTLTEPYRQALTYVSEAPQAPSRTVLPLPLRQALWATRTGDVLFWLAVTAALLIAAGLRRAPIRGKWVIALLFIAALACAFVTWHTGAGAYARVFVPTGVALRLAMLLAIMFSADALRRARSRHPARRDAVRRHRDRSGTTARAA
jgi:hypothetical protein